MVFSKVTINRVLQLLLVLAFPAAAQALEVRPKAGFTYDYFGETYRVTDDRDTVTTINDYGALVGLYVARAPTSPLKLRADGDLYYGHESARARLLLRGEYHRGANSFLIDQDAIGRKFHEGGDYSLSSNSFQETARLTWDHRFSETTMLRMFHLFEAIVYSDPDQYNLDSFLQRPGISVRQRFGLGNEVRAGYQLGWRDVPDSSELDSVRHVGEVDGAVLINQFSIDFSERIERRIYDEPSPRESSWEGRSDGIFEWMRPGRFTGRVRHSLEVVEYDDADDLDFNFTRLRVAAGPVMRTERGIDFSVEPLFGMLYSKTAPDENYHDWAVEVGMEIRFARTWISLTDEVGHRDYEFETTGEVIDFVNTSASASDDVPLYSDSTYNRLTALVSADVGRSVTFHLFANWEPENHRLDRYDSESRIVSGGVEYRF